MSSQSGARGRVLVALWLGTLSLSAAAAELRGTWEQGAVIFGNVLPGTQLSFQGRSVRVSPDGLFVLGLDRDEAASVSLSLREPGRPPEIQRHEVAPRRYDIQRIDGLPPSKVTPPAAVQQRIEHEQAAVLAARKRDTAITEFAQPFIWPCLGRISGVYGSQRILNGEKKQPHYGVDVAVPTGTPVRAPAGGVISFAEPDLYYTGGTLLIDHGHGLVSAFLHLSTLKVKVGQTVKQGDIVALSGATGRATGPHLDWRISWFEARVDPQRLVPPMPGDRVSR